MKPDLSAGLKGPYIPTRTVQRMYLKTSTPLIFKLVFKIPDFLCSVTSPDISTAPNLPLDSYQFSEEFEAM